MKYLDENGLLYYTQKIKNWLNNKVDKETGKGLSENDYTSAEKTKLAGIAAGAEVNVQADWNATSGDAAILNKPIIPEGVTLYNATGQNTDGAMTQKATTDALAGKVNTVSGKGLSTNDFTTTLKNKLDGIEAQANKTVVDSSMSGSSTNPVQNKVIKTYVDNAISGVTQFDVQVVTALPTTGVKGVIYLKAHSHGTGDVYDEYIWTGSAFEKIGNTDIDLSGYATTTALTNGLAGKVDKVSGKGLSTNDFTTALKNKLDGIDLSGYVQTADLTAITNAEIDTICS